VKLPKETVLSLVKGSTVFINNLGGFCFRSDSFLLCWNWSFVRLLMFFFACSCSVCSIPFLPQEDTALLTRFHNVILARTTSPNPSSIKAYQPLTFSKRWRRINLVIWLTVFRQSCSVRNITSLSLIRPLNATFFFSFSLPRAFEEQQGKEIDDDERW